MLFTVEVPLNFLVLASTFLFLLLLLGLLLRLQKLWEQLASLELNYRVAHKELHLVHEVTLWRCLHHF